MDEYQDILASLRQTVDRVSLPQPNNTVGSLFASGQATVFVGNQSSADMKASEVSIAAKIRDTLFECDPVDDRDRLTSDNGPRTPNTCEWILEEHSFKQWRESSPHTGYEDRCLWISGRLGVGKTYMAILVTEELEKTLQHDSEILLYFFCTHQSQERRHATGVLRGLIYTLLKKHESPQIVSIIESQFDPMNKPKEARAILGSVTALWRILTTLIDVLTKHRCIQIVIDALDECDDESFRILSANFRGLCNAYANVKVLLFTRDSAPLHDWRSVKLVQGHDERIKSDVGKFSRQVAQQIVTRHGLSSLNIDRLTEQLVEGADGSFLWIGFAAQSLSMPIIKTQDELYNRLNNFPKKLESVFNRILERINSTQIEKSAAILRTIALASRPLSVLEVAAFVASEEPWEVTTRDALAAEQETRNAIEGCTPLISISNDDGRVSVTHFSVRQYLLRLKNLSLPNDSPLKTFAFDEEVNRLPRSACNHAPCN